MREFLLNRTNWFILIIWGMAAGIFNLWQLASNGDISQPAMIFMLVPTLLLGWRSYLVLKSQYCG